MNQNIVPTRYTVVCQSSSPISCQVGGMSATQRTVLFPYDADFEGIDITFNVSYSPELCESSSVETTLTGNL